MAGTSRMGGRVAASLVCALTILCGRMAAQQVDAGVDAVDLSVRVRVQDPDQQRSGVILGGLSEATWKPQNATNSVWWYAAANDSSHATLYNPATTPSQPSRPPSASTWGAPANSSAGYISSNEGRDLSSPRYARSLKSGVKRTSVLGQAMGLDVASLSNTNLGLSNLNSTNLETLDGSNFLAAHADQAVLARIARRKANRFAPRSGRLQLNAFQNRADVQEESVARWQQDSYKMQTLEEQRHESALLVRYGYNAQSQRRRRKGKDPLGAKWRKDR